MNRKQLTHRLVAVGCVFFGSIIFNVVYWHFYNEIDPSDAFVLPSGRVIELQEIKPLGREQSVLVDVYGNEYPVTNQYLINAARR